MAWRYCATVGCKHRLREGLVRHGEGGDGQPLADGTFCWRCRRKHATASSRKEAKEKACQRDERAALHRP